MYIINSVECTDFWKMPGVYCISVYYEHKDINGNTLATCYNKDIEDKSYGNCNNEDCPINKKKEN